MGPDPGSLISLQLTLTRRRATRIYNVNLRDVTLCNHSGGLKRLVFIMGHGECSVTERASHHCIQFRDI